MDQFLATQGPVGWLLSSVPPEHGDRGVPVRVCAACSAKRPEHHAIQPGTGCSMDIVEAIRTELQRRVPRPR